MNGCAPSTVFKLLVLVPVWILMPAGCDSHPMTSSFTELTAETRRQKTPHVEYHEILSIAGTLPVIEPGVFYHYPKANMFQRLVFQDKDARTPSYAIGLSPDMDQTTFYLVGTTGEDVSQESVLCVKQALENVETKAAKAIRLTLQIAKERAISNSTTGANGAGDSVGSGGTGGATGSLPEPGEAEELAEQILEEKLKGLRETTEETEESNKTDVTKPDNQPETASETTTQEEVEGEEDPPAEDDPNIEDAGNKEQEDDSQPATRLAELQKQLDRADLELEVAEKVYFGLLNRYPGIHVSRWATGSSSGSSVNAGAGVISASGSDEQMQSGFVVMGGYRLAMLYFGGDYITFIRGLSDSEFKQFTKLGVTTYMIQTRHTGYTSNRELSQLRHLTLSMSASQLGDLASFITEIDQITISSYFARVESLQNSSTFSGMSWHIVNRPMVKYISLDSKDQDLIKTKIAEDKSFSSLTKLAQTRGLDWVRLDHQGVFDPLASIPAGDKQESDTAINLIEPTASKRDPSRQDNSSAEKVAGAEAKPESPNTKQDETRETLQWQTVYSVIAKAPNLYRTIRSGNKPGWFGRWHESQIPQLVVRIGERHYALVDTGMRKVSTTNSNNVSGSAENQPK